MEKCSKLLLATSWYSVRYISQLNLLRNIFIFAQQHPAARLMHTDSRNSFGLICLLGLHLQTFTIHKYVSKVLVLVTTMYTMCTRMYWRTQTKSYGSYVHSCDRPLFKVLLRSCRRRSPSLAVATVVVPLYLLCWNIWRGVAFASIWFIAMHSM